MTASARTLLCTVSGSVGALPQRLQRRPGPGPGRADLAAGGRAGAVPALQCGLLVRAPPGTRTARSWAAAAAARPCSHRAPHPPAASPAARSAPAAREGGAVRAHGPAGGAGRGCTRSGWACSGRAHRRLSLSRRPRRPLPALDPARRLRSGRGQRGPAALESAGLGPASRTGTVPVSEGGGGGTRPSP